jgi:osmoprotectant transport system substrate-binding protein
MTPMRRLLNPLLTACLSTVVVTSTVLATAQASEPVVVSSKIDTEGSVLGELIIQTLERNGIATQDRLQLGATSVVRNALLAAEIDVYPEYTGNGAFFFDMTDSPVWNSADDAYQTVRERDAEQGLIWLQPASANSAVAQVKAAIRFITFSVMKKPCSKVFTPQSSSRLMARSLKVWAPT